MLILFIIVLLLPISQSSYATDYDGNYSVIKSVAISDRRTSTESYGDSVLSNYYHDTVGNVYLIKINHKKHNGWSVRDNDIATKNPNPNEHYQIYSPTYEINLYTKN